MAQFDSNVQGTVTDASGAAIPRATVRLLNTTTGVENRATTDNAGFYRFSGIIGGAYRVTVEAAGLQKAERRVNVTTQETAGVNVSLDVAKATTTVAVDEQVAGINPDETRQVTTLTNRQLVELPLAQRGTLNLIQLAPGAVSTDPATPISNIPIGSQQPPVVANGRPASSNLYRLDGISVMSAQSYGNLNLVPAPDMVAETALQTNTFQPEVGGTSSLVVDLTTRSGANRFHGDLDGTYSSRYFSQHPWNVDPSAPYTQKFLSGGLGGPIIKNRTFFFGSAETQKVQNSEGGQIGQIDTDAFYEWAKAALPDSRVVNRYFSFRPSRVAITGVSKYASDIWPASGGSAGLLHCGTASTAFIPCNLPVLGSGNFAASSDISGTQYNVRLDHYFRSNQDRIFANYFRVDQTSAFLSYRPANDSVTPSTTEFAAIHYVHTFTPTLVNQVQFGWTRFHSFFGGVGENNWVVTPYIFFDVGFAGTDKLGFYGYFPPDVNPGGFNNKDHEYRFRDYANWVKGSHSIRAGFDATHQDYYLDNSQAYARPFIVQFSSFWNLLNDNPYSYQLYSISAQTGQFIGQVFGSQVTQFGLYAQDDWKIRPNLTLSYGVRWDDYGNPYQYGDRSQPFVNVALNGPTGTRAEFQQSIVNTASTAFVKNAFTGRMNGNFLPRAGLAWSLGKDGKTLVRAGFGLYADGLDLNSVTSNLPTQPPNRLTLTLNSSNPNLPPPGKVPYGTSAAPPYGFDYPAIHLGGFDSRGAALDMAGNVISSDLNGIDPNLKAQKSAIWNFGLQRELPSRIVVEGAYSGTHSWDGFYQPNWNLSPGVSNGLTKEWGKIKYLRNGFSTNYHAMIFSARQSFARATWTASYTWSHALGDQFLANSQDIAAIVYGTSNFDVRHHFSFAGTYQFPSPRETVLKEVLGNWTIGSVVTAQTGTPYTVPSSSNLLNDGDNCAPCSVPNLVAGTQTDGFSRDQYKSGVLPTAVVGGSRVAAGFSLPGAPNVNGNEPVNAFRGPGNFTWNASAVKRITLPWLKDQTSALTFRVEGLNILNRTNLALFNVSNQAYSGPTTPVPALYGQATSAAPPRIIQLGARFEF